MAGWGQPVGSGPLATAKSPLPTHYHQVVSEQLNISKLLWGQLDASARMERRGEQVEGESRAGGGQSGGQGGGAHLTYK